MGCDLCRIRMHLGATGRTVIDLSHCPRCHRTVRAGQGCACRRHRVMAWMEVAVSILATGIVLGLGLFYF